MTADLQTNEILIFSSQSHAPEANAVERRAPIFHQYGRLAIADAHMAAHVFMSMVVSAPVRFIVAGTPLARKELDRRVAFAVRMFLDGARPR